MGNRYGRTEWEVRVSFENCAHTWKILATLLIERLLLERNWNALANGVTTRKDKPQDSSRKSPLKIDHEVVAADDRDELEGFWSGAIFQGSAGKIMYDGHSLFDLENSEKLKANR